ncbi:MAG: FAD-dependent oxidoreductase [Pseudomonadota bacterium]
MQIDCDILIVGGGMAAARLVHELREQQYSGRIVVASREPQMGYNRVLLPGFLAGECTLRDLCSSSHSTDERLNVCSGVDVVGIDLMRRRATLSDASRASFDRLVFATGSAVPVPQISGAPAERLTEFRNLDDAQRLRDLVAQSRCGAVVGGGLLGLEAADAIAAMGLPVRLIHRGPRLMTRQLDDLGSELLAAAMQANGVDVTLNTTIEQMQMNPHGDHVINLSNGESYRADFVVLATGAQPADRLAAAAGLEVDSGIVTDEYLRASRTGVYALGECANVAGARQQLVDHVNAQAAALATTLTGEPAAVHAPPVGTRLKVHNIALVAAGEMPAASQVEPGDDITIRDQARGVYRRLGFAGNRLAGAVLFGDTAGAREIVAHLGRELDMEQRERLAFGLV